MGDGLERAVSEHKREAMLDPWIIDEILRKEKEKRDEEKREQPRYDKPQYDQEQDSNKPGYEKDRGVVTLDI